MTGKKLVVDRLKITFTSLGKKHGSSSSNEVDSSSSSSSSSSMRISDRSGGNTTTTTTPPWTRRDTVSTTSSSSNEEEKDFLSIDLQWHCLGEYSLAVLKGNSVMEDFCEIVVGRKSTFFGIYDGHGGGNEVAQYVSDNFFQILMDHVRDTGTMSRDSLTQAFNKIETKWVAKVEEKFDVRPEIASMGASCLVGVVWGGHFYVANVGGCRAIKAELPYEVAIDHNMKHQPIMLPLSCARQTDNSRFSVKIGNRDLIKGRSELAKSIGDSYLKYPQFNLDAHGFKLNEPLDPRDEPPVSSEPFTTVIPIDQEFVRKERFILFASKGFWDVMKDDEAARLVKTCPKKGIAAKLIRETLKRVAKSEGKSYSEILNAKDKSGKNVYHDDITVIVIFFNASETVIKEEVSVKVGESSLSALDNALQGTDEEALERTEQAGDLDQAAREDEGLERTQPTGDLDQSLQGADEALDGTQPTDLDQPWQGANEGR